LCLCAWLAAHRRGAANIERPLSGTKFDGLEFRFVVGYDGKSGPGAGVDERLLYGSAFAAIVVILFKCCENED
jgi:hypothetical protein